MDSLSHTEENYLKAIFKLCESGNKTASTNAVADLLNTTAASVSDMLKRLSGKDLLHYEKHRGATLTTLGNDLATMLVRKHRLWEVFLVDTLHFSWDEVHEMAEQLEHVQSIELTDRLDAYLGHPRFDPHGDPIPDAQGRFLPRKQLLLASLETGVQAVVVGVQEHSAAFLQYLDRVQLGLGTSLVVLERYVFDGALRLKLGDGQEITISNKVSENLFVQKTK